MIMRECLRVFEELFSKDDTFNCQKFIFDLLFVEVQQKAEGNTGFGSDPNAMDVDGAGGSPMNSTAVSPDGNPTS